MKVNERTERNDWPTKRQRFAYDAGYQSGKKTTEETLGARRIYSENLNAQMNASRMVNLENQNDRLGRDVASLRRELTFANDRIEQLTNSVVIIRDKK